LNLRARQIVCCDLDHRIFGARISSKFATFRLVLELETAVWVYFRLEIAHRVVLNVIWNTKAGTREQV
jgi:hypothetical protein